MARFGSAFVHQWVNKQLSSVVVRICTWLGLDRHARNNKLVTITLFWSITFRNVYIYLQLRRSLLTSITAITPQWIAALAGRPCFWIVLLCLISGRQDSLCICLHTDKNYQQIYTSEFLFVTSLFHSRCHVICWCTCPHVVANEVVGKVERE